MQQGILLGILAFLAVEDMRKRKLSVPLLCLAGVAGAGMHIWQKDMPVAVILPGAAVGLVLILLGVLTRESIGMGDGAMFMMTGIFLGGAGNVELLLTSLLYAAVFSMGVLTFCYIRRNTGTGRKKTPGRRPHIRGGRHHGMDRKREIPFAPFVFLGYLTMVLEAVV